MTLSKKKSRPITVDEKDFRYIISLSKLDDDRNFSLNVTIQIASGKGAALLVRGLVTRDFWLDFSDPFIREMDAYPTLYPSHIEQFIKSALQQGWKPEITGSVFILNLDNTTVFNSDYHE